jgi:hypothetical protein
LNPDNPHFLKGKDVFDNLYLLYLNIANGDDETINHYIHSLDQCMDTELYENLKVFHMNDKAQSIENEIKALLSENLSLMTDKEANFEKIKKILC